jgi:hypothetical protein
MIACPFRIAFFFRSGFYVAITLRVMKLFTVAITAPRDGYIAERDGNRKDGVGSRERGIAWNPS